MQQNDKKCIENDCKIVIYLLRKSTLSCVPVSTWIKMWAFFLHGFEQKCWGAACVPALGRRFTEYSPHHSSYQGVLATACIISAIIVPFVTAEKRLVHETMRGRSARPNQERVDIVLNNATTSYVRASLTLHVSMCWTILWSTMHCCDTPGHGHTAQLQQLFNNNKKQQRRSSTRFDLSGNKSYYKHSISTWQDALLYFFILNLIHAIHINRNAWKSTWKVVDTAQSIIQTEEKKSICTKTRSLAVSRIADRTGCQWSSKSSKVDDFYLIWKSVCDFLLVINSNFGHIFYRLATIARTDFQDHPRSMIFILSDRAYDTSS